MDVLRINNVKFTQIGKIQKIIVLYVAFHDDMTRYFYKCFEVTATGRWHFIITDICYIFCIEAMFFKVSNITCMDGP